MWMQTADTPEGVVVMTKIDDENGVRNEGTLKRVGNLWWVPDGSMYVYYRPTHYRRLTAAEQQSEVDKAKRTVSAAEHAAQSMKF